jgi:hypothetical protein
VEATIFSNLALVAIALGGIDMPIADTKRGLDRFDADRIHQRHGSEADRGDLCAVGFDEIHRMFFLGSQQPQFFRLTPHFLDRVSMLPKMR